MPNKPQTPGAALKNIFENITFDSILWLLITSFVIYIVIKIALKQYKKNSYTIGALATWSTITFFTAISTYSYFGYYIGLGGSWGWYSICFVFSFLTVYAAHRELHKYQRLITTFIVIIICGCVFWSFMAGEQAIMFGIMFGIFQGSTFQLFLITLFRYLKNIQSRPNKISEDDEDWDRKKMI